MKEKLRKEIKEKRRKIPKEDNRKKSKEIKERLFGLGYFKEAETVLFYVSYGSEVFTHDMIKESLDLGKRIVVPISKPEDRSLILSELLNWDELEVGSYGILEPKKECIRKISLDEIDLIIVPGIAFDKKGNRIGHGKGYYDNLLRKAICKSVGLGFGFQIVEELPVGDNDVPVDLIITEQELIVC